MNGYDIPSYDSNTIGQSTVDLTDTTLTSLIASPGPGKRLFITWLWAVNRTGTATGIKLYSGTDKIATCPAGTVGACPPMPTPLVLGEAKALQVQLEDVTNITITVGYAYGPKG